MYAGLKHCIKCGKPLYGLFDTDMCVDCSKTLVTATDHTEQVSYESLYIPKSVIEDIRAEVEKVFCMSVVTNELRTPMEVKTEILQIIDKHVKAVEE